MLSSNCYRDHTYLHSFPTRRSSDLMLQDIAILTGGKAITEDLGIKLENVQMADLGQAKVGHLDVLQLDAEVRSEEHTSELQSRGHLVCRLLLEKKKYMSTPMTQQPN